VSVYGGEVFTADEGATEIARLSYDTEEINLNPGETIEHKDMHIVECALAYLLIQQIISPSI
jgi:hypothetical protein